jgi:hypothetical protein
VICHAFDSAQESILLAASPRARAGRLVENEAGERSKRGPASGREGHRYAPPG